MEMGNNASLRVAGLLRDRTGPRPSAMLRRGRRRLRPMAEDLEGRTLLSVGLDPTYGFGGVAELGLPPNTATTTYYQIDQLDRLAERQGCGGRGDDCASDRRAQHHQLER